MNRSLRIVTPLRDAPAIAAHGCRLCLRPISKLDELCGRCRKELAPTPLDGVLDALSMSERAFADMTGIAFRTVLRAAKGEKMSERTAQRLSKITRMPAERFRELAPRAA